MSHTTQHPTARQLRLNVRLSRQEWDKVHKLASNTTCRSVSEYARKVLAEKPVRVFFRNQSFDEFEESMTRLLPQLEAYGDHFALLVKKLSSMESTPEMIANLPLMLACEKNFIRQMEMIKDYIIKISDQCDPK
jgi:hypothetical protein